MHRTTFLPACAVIAALTLTACSSFKTTGTMQVEELQHSLSPAFADSLQAEEWLANEYRHYLDSDGNKAFAVFWRNGIPRASGFGDDKLTPAIAQQEALRLCNAYAGEETGCIIEHSSLSDREPVKQNLYPQQVISYSDVDHWEQYKATTGHKAVAGNFSGILGGSEGDTKADAEAKAMKQCHQNTHFSAPTCYIIASE